ncbi:unnamed protein product [Calypogeia fissa]
MKVHEMAMLGVLLSFVMLLQSVRFSEAQSCGSAVNNTVCQDGLCCSQFGFCGGSTAYCGTGCQSNCVSNTPPPGPTVKSTSRLGKVLNESVFNLLWPGRNKFYQYNSLVLASNAFPLFLSSRDKECALRELAAFAAHVQQETGGLVYITEIDKSGNYCDPTSVQYPCAKNQLYYGRGPVQLSWNFNYGAASPAVRADILAHPNRVAMDPVLAFKTALWFWTTPSGSIPSIHDVITGKYVPTEQDIKLGRLDGFGLTIDIINGELECGKATPQAANRVTYFLQFSSLLGVDPGPNLTCDKMAPF